MRSADDITQMLRDVDAGTPGAMDALMDALYEDLRRMAHAHLRQQFHERAGVITLEPAALVNEAFMRLIQQRNAFDNRGHFFSIATRTMLRVLADYRREKHAAKRGGERRRVTLQLDDRSPPEGCQVSRHVEIQDLSRALDKLEALDSRKADIVKLRVVWGLEIQAIGEVLGVSASTVDRDWRFARAWIGDEVGLIDPAGVDRADR